MEALFAWIESSTAYAVFRAANRVLWRLWRTSATGRLFEGDLGAAWRNSEVGHTAAWLTAWIRRSAVATLLTALAGPQPSALAGWLRPWIGAERAMFRSTSFEKWLLYFVATFVPLEVWLITRLPSSIKYLGDVALVLLLVLTLLRLQQAGWPLRRSPADLPIMLLLAAAALSTVWNAVPLSIAAFGTRAYMEYYALYLVLVYLPWGDHERRGYILWFLALGIAIALFGDVQKFLHFATPRQWLSAIEQATTRAYGTMGNPNTFGAILVSLVSILSALLVLQVRGAVRVLALLGLTVALPALVFTLSREALLAAVASVLVVGFAADRRLLLLLILGLAALPVVDPHIVSRFATALSGDYLGASSTYGRLFFMQRGIEAFLAQPLLGWGPGRFGGSVAHIFGSPAYIFVHLGERPVIDSQHVQTLVELGAVGYIAYLLLGWAAVRTGLQLFRRDADPFWRAIGLGLAAGTIGLYVQSLFASLLETHQVIIGFWLIFGMAAYRQRAQDVPASGGRPVAAAGGLPPERTPAAPDGMH